MSAKIRNRVLIAGANQDLETLQSFERLPDEIASKVLLTYDLNRKKIVKMFDSNPNDIVKTFTVPVGKQWEIISIGVDYTADATVGSRRIGVRIDDENGQVHQNIIDDFGQTASTTVFHNFHPYAGERDNTTTFVFCPVPVGAYPENWSITISDVNNIAATDDMTVSLIVYESTYVRL